LRVSPHKPSVDLVIHHPNVYVNEFLDVMGGSAEGKNEKKESHDVVMTSSSSDAHKRREREREDFESSPPTKIPKLEAASDIDIPPQ
jgi:hypothetical protein